MAEMASFCGMDPDMVLAPCAVVRFLRVDTAVWLEEIRNGCPRCCMLALLSMRRQRSCTMDPQS